MDIHKEIEELVSRGKLDLETETEPVSKEKFDEIQHFLEGTRQCTVGGFVYDEDAEMLLVKHAGEPTWIQPGGMVETGEDLETALTREVREETGVEIEVEEPAYAWRGEYVHGTDEIAWYGTMFFAEAEDPSIGDELGLEDEEITDAKWFKQLPDELHELATPERFRTAMEEIEKRV